MLVGRGTWDGVRGCRNIGPKVPSEPGERGDSMGNVEGDKIGTVAGSEVDAEMSTYEAGTENGGAFPSLDFIV